MVFVYRQRKFFLSVYVDDFEVAGKSKAVDQMWITLGRKLDLEAPISICDNAHSDCGQEEIPPSADSVAEKADMYEKLCKAKLIPQDVTA